MHRFLLPLLVVWLLAGTGERTYAGEKPMVRIKTSLGEMVVELDADRAPKTVENFLAYVRGGHYDGTIFHRVIDGFMIQGGGFNTDFDQKPTQDPIENEADNGLRNDRGTIAMARTSDPHSATAQFFINVVDNDFLNHTGKNPRGWGYAVFGRVVEGMETVDAIRQVPTGQRPPFKDVPKDTVTIESVRLEAAAEDG